MAYIIAGLGNPGEEYTNTRHNTGRIILELLAKKYSFEEFKEKPAFRSLISAGTIGKEKVILLEPNNFMNRSGASVALALGVRLPKQPKVIVIYDDLDLAIGSMKISFNRSSGGHRGLESIIKALKTQEFLRIRIGISPTTPSGKLKKPQGEAAVEKHILGEFKKPELDELKKLSKNVAGAIETIFTDSKEKAMTLFNK